MNSLLSRAGFSNRKVYYWGCFFIVDIVHKRHFEKEKYNRVLLKFRHLIIDKWAVRKFYTHCYSMQTLAFNPSEDCHFKIKKIPVVLHSSKDKTAQIYGQIFQTYLVCACNFGQKKPCIICKFTAFSNFANNMEGIIVSLFKVVYLIKAKGKVLV